MLYTDLMKEVNPVFATAQTCLLVMAEAGDPAAKKLISELGFDRQIASIEKDALTEMEKFKRMKAVPGFTAMIEARFTASSNLIRQMQARVIVDLHCGYTSRGLRVLLMMTIDRPDSGSLKLCGLKPAVRSVLEAAGFDQLDGRILFPFGK